MLDWNRKYTRRLKIVLLPRMWELDAALQLGSDPQAAVNQQLVDSSDILVGILWTRLGSVFKLIPLSLDGYMFTAQWDLGLLANEIRSRVAADFRDWQNDDAKFNHQVSRVIKSLRADEGAQEPPPCSRL
jgi:hypothetical protein